MKLWINFSDSFEYISTSIITIDNIMPEFDIYKRLGDTFINDINNIKSTPSLLLYMRNKSWIESPKDSFSSGDNYSYCFKYAGTHATHCCVIHGCKYGDEDCPVVSGEIKQEYACEYCDEPLEQKFYSYEDVKDAFKEGLKMYYYEVCPGNEIQFNEFADKQFNEYCKQFSFQK